MAPFSYVVSAPGSVPSGPGYNNSRRGRSETRVDASGLFPLFPAMRLRQARAITREFCRLHGIPYNETGFVRALVEAANHFRTVPPARLAAEALS